MMKQNLAMVPGREHYAARYLQGGRLFSYAHQMNAVLEYEPQTMLEVGPGPGMVTAAMRALGIEVTTADIQPELRPDVVASVSDLPFEDDSFDVSMCCQVLEHLPFDQFQPALKELWRVSRRAMVISVPDARPHYHLSCKVPKFSRLQLDASRPKRITKQRIERVWSGSGHYWEIGYPGFGLRVILERFANAGLTVQRRWRPAEMAYHHFFTVGV